MQKCLGFALQTAPCGRKKDSSKLLSDPQSINCCVDVQRVLWPVPNLWGCYEPPDIHTVPFLTGEVGLCDLNRSLISESHRRKSSGLKDQKTLEDAIVYDL